MNALSHPKRVGIVGNYLPRKCGIATFTYDLCQSLLKRFHRMECLVAPVNDGKEIYQYPDEVRFEIAEQDLQSYRTAAEFLNISNVDTVCLQHEFGIFGGPAGSHVLELIQRLDAPLITTLHTILETPDKNQRAVMSELTDLSTRLIVMSERGRVMLEELYAVPAEKIDVIHHGVPDMPFIDPAYFKDGFDVQGKKVILTFGLLSPGKGIEFVIEAMPQILSKIPNAVYIVLGATHPNLVREQGEVYRGGLMERTQELGVSEAVHFHNRFVELEELKAYIGAADVYVTPYLAPNQITSGTLAYAYGCGKAIVSTPYWHAQELLQGGRGIIVPFRDSVSIAEAVVRLLDDEVTLHTMRKQAYLDGRGMIWPRAAEAYVRSFDRGRFRAVRISSSQQSPSSNNARRPVKFPSPDLSHLARMTDSTGIFQHAFYDMPDFGEGYCSDDNARALLLTVLLEETGDANAQVKSLGTVYASFLNHAFDRDNLRFRNFLSFGRQWLEKEGSADCMGRFVWVLGHCLARSQRRYLRRWAANRFDEALSLIENATAPRTQAFGLLGLHEYFRHLPGARHGKELRENFSSHLYSNYQEHQQEDWHWFEDKLTYANAKLPHALLVTGHALKRQDWIQAALQSLRWLIRIQTTPGGWFRPVGSNGFYPRGGERALFDQQPIEAHATISACLAAHQVTKETLWWQEANKAFAWFLGQNDLKLPLYRGDTGGCCDGLHTDRANENQGAESLLAYLLSLQELRIANGRLCKGIAVKKSSLPSPKSQRQPSPSLPSLLRNQ